MNAPEPFASVVNLQRQASDPLVSAWVSANAGSGKTYVLAQRVIRLLLEGTDPSKILCLTFTRAAAANMANRVFDTLAAWTAYDDARLDEAMRNIGIGTVTPARRARARKLFAQALETPGGLKVQTIHAFCTRLLQQFPFEANVAARFAVLDQRASDELLNDATLRVLTTAAATPDTAAGQSLATATADTADSTFRQVIGEAIKQRNALLAWIAAAGGIEGAARDLSRALEISSDDSLVTLEKDLTEGPHFPLSQWSAVAEVCRSSSANDQKQGERLVSAAAAGGTDRFSNYFMVFFGEKAPRKAILTGALAKQHPDVAACLDRESRRVPELRRRYNAINCRDRTVALLTLATEIVERYRAEKERRGLLDYDDLIDKTLYLLDHVEAAWVHYKLDLGMDHVLIDEAQDTSRKQWEIITRLVAEFTAGAGARGNLRRTIFAVGDDKQSIFSFQGAVPEVFALQGSEFLRRHQASQLPFLPVEMKHSFRSLQIILDAVDEVFKQPAVHQGLSADNTATAHIAVRAQAPGHVEIWPLEEPSKRTEIEAWDAPFDTETESNPRARLAAKIAKAVKAWIARGDVVGEGNKRHPVRAGDILILVRQRGALFEAIIRALKNLDVAVAGADRLVLTEHIAVMDLMALGDALLLPEDELALATVLKSPLIGLSEDDLFALAWQRKGSLRAALREHAGDAPRYAQAAATLDRLAAWAKHESPFAFFARVLGPERGRKRLLARLGAEAADALDEFLELALDYERRETPSLQGFLDWLRSANTEIKRDMEMVRDEVRVMTVHGAKGLEAPIVILADTTTEPAGPPQRAPRLLPLPAERAAPGTPDRLLWIGYKADDTAVVANVRTAAQTAAEHEYRRLLYVGMTRAADRLVICGTAGEKPNPPGCWYDIIKAALAPKCDEVPADHGDGNVLRWARGEAELPPPRPVAQDARKPAPDWLDRPAPAEPLRRDVKPSDEEETARRSFAGSAQARRMALLRGSLAHRLLQSLPDVPLTHRSEAAQRYLARAGKDLSAGERDALAAEILRVIAAEPFAPLFATGSRAEVPIVGRLQADDGQTIAVSGQVDRLVVTEDAVMIADFKTNRPPPRRVDNVPRSYIRQLALYRALLAKIYAGRQIRAALVFTDVPDLMELSAEILDAALAKVLAQIKVQ